MLFVLRFRSILRRQLVCFFLGVFESMEVPPARTRGNGPSSWYIPQVTKQRACQCAGTSLRHQGTQSDTSSKPDRIMSV